MKIDICIMNPPYMRNLHLKILAKINSSAEETINISPCSSFENVNERSKISEEIRPYIKALKVIDKKVANGVFGIVSAANLAIFRLSKEKVNMHKFRYEKLIPVVERLRRQQSWRSAFTYDEKEYQYHCQGDSGFYKGVGLSAKGLLKGKCNARLVFATQKEKDNFYNSLDCWPYKLMRIIDNGSAIPAHLPFMIDYTNTWDDDRFRDYFCITDEEWSEIENEIEK